MIAGEMVNRRRTVLVGHLSAGVGTDVMKTRTKDDKQSKKKKKKKHDERDRV